MSDAATRASKYKGDLAATEPGGNMASKIRDSCKRPDHSAASRTLKLKRASVIGTFLARGELRELAFFLTIRFTRSLSGTYRRPRNRRSQGNRVFIPPHPIPPHPGLLEWA